MPYQQHCMPTSAAQCNHIISLHMASAHLIITDSRLPQNGRRAPWPAWAQSEMGGWWASEGEMGLGAGRTVGGRWTYAPVQWSSSSSYGRMPYSDSGRLSDSSIPCVHMSGQNGTNTPTPMHRQIAIHAPVPRDGLSLAHELHVHAHNATAVSMPSTCLVWVGLEGMEAGYGEGTRVVRIRNRVGGGMALLLLLLGLLLSSCAEEYEFA